MMTKDMLCEISHTLTEMVYGELTHLECVNTCELGATIDMIKDIQEAIYYHTIVKAMESGKDVSTVSIDTATNGTISATKHP